MVNTHNSSVRIGKEKAAITVKQKKLERNTLAFVSILLQFAIFSSFYFYTDI
jgi:hypothetical protein